MAACRIQQCVNRAGAQYRVRVQEQQIFGFGNGRPSIAGNPEAKVPFKCDKTGRVVFGQLPQAVLIARRIVDDDNRGAGWHG